MTALRQTTPFRWAVQSLGPTVILTRSARAGEIGPRLAVDKALWDDPYPHYDEARNQGKLLRGRWVAATASHDVVSEVLRNPVFRVGIDAASLSPFARRLFNRSIDERSPGPAEPPSMLAVDPPQHTTYRRLVSKVFTARRVAALEPRVEAIADELLDRMEKQRSVDLVESYAAPLPVRIIAEILGVPEHMHEQMLEWGNAAAVTLDPALSYRAFRRASIALREMHAWLGVHLNELRRNPGDDLLSHLATFEDEGDRLNDVELRSTALLVTGAGFETTVNLIGNAVAALVRNRDQLDRLKADPALWPNATDETLRYDSPVQVTVRHAADATQVCGFDIPRGQLVQLMLAGANRDPEVFPDPHTFDVGRENARDHLAFSAGIHYCLGASLARLEGAVALRKLFERFPDLAIAGEPVRRPLRVLRGFEHLPVSLVSSRTSPPPAPSAPRAAASARAADTPG
jgi:cytochrome P450